MQNLPGHLLGIVLILAIEKPAFIDARREFKRTSFDPLDFSLGKKSCSDGYVHAVDNFIVSGFVNLTNERSRKHAVKFSVWFIRFGRRDYNWNQIGATYFALLNESCTDIQHVPLDKCGCKYESDTMVLVKCNLTADEEYHKKPMILSSEILGPHFSEYQNMTKIYKDTTCTDEDVPCDVNKGRASTNGGTSLHDGNSGQSGQVLLLTALICGVSPIVFNGP
ncbi:unnamed protein product [Lymnaea stagnalis]|uniref:Uncharacterized protein n=1 Tax=Lymnaea stagnalis TaxID=6523 RepID=A0AAV2H6Y5_LYMST